MTKKTTRALLFALATKNVADAISAGYSLADARRAGYSLADAISAGYSLADARRAGYSLADARRAGYSLADAISAGYSLDSISEWESIPVLEKPYTKLLADLKESKRIHDQSTWGPETGVPEENVCGTPMCTAGHLVNMAGRIGYELKVKYGWQDAATMIHTKCHPDQPVQDFGSIPQAWAMAYIETMAEREAEAETGKGESK